MPALANYSNLIQGTEEWLELRKKHIGASDAPVIMGVSPWVTPYQLWLEKLDLAPSRAPTAAMKRGIDKEKDARELFMKQTGVNVSPKVLFHPDIKWMMSSFDGIDDEKKIAVEIKCPMNEIDLQMAREGKVPDKYFPQLQHQMEVAKLNSICYYSYDGEEGALITVDRDSKYIEKMLKEEAAFYECMQSFVAPKLSDDDFEDREDEEWREAARKLRLAETQLEFFETEVKIWRDELITLAKGENSRGGGIKLTKCLRKGAIEYGKIPELKGVNLEKYRKENIEYYKISDARS